MNTSNLYITYEIGGLHPAVINEAGNPFVGYADDLDIRLMERQYDDEPRLVAKFEMTRIPSDKRTRMNSKYNMLDVMRTEKSAGGHIIARDFENPELYTRNINDLLRHGDVYILRRFYVTGSYQNKGYDVFAMQNVKAWIHRITGDANSIMVASTTLYEISAIQDDLKKLGFQPAPFKSPVLYF